MKYFSYYNSPIGKLTLVGQGDTLSCLLIEGQKHYCEAFKGDEIRKDDEEIFIKTKNLLDKYFKGEKIDFKDIKLNLNVSSFSKLVLEEVQKIPYGKTLSYKAISNIVKLKLKKPNMSSQAIGNAVSKNPILIIIPCHRVIKENGKIGGYAGGVEKKEMLMRGEKILI